MSHVTHPKIHVAPRRRTIVRPRTRARSAHEESNAAPLTLAAIVVCTPLVAAAVALAGALAA